jgi:hypothetical protein
MDLRVLGCNWYQTVELDWPSLRPCWPPPVESERSYQRDADGRVNEADSQFLDRNQDDCYEKKETRHRKSGEHYRERLKNCVHSCAPFALARRRHRQSNLPPCRARGNRFVASLLPAPFGLFTVAARLLSLGFEPERDLTPAARWSPFRCLEPTLSDWQQPSMVRMLPQPVGVSFPLNNDFRSFRCSS